LRIHVAGAVVADEAVLRQRRLRQAEAIEVARLADQLEGWPGISILAVAGQLPGDDHRVRSYAGQLPVVGDGEERLLPQVVAGGSAGIDSQPLALSVVVETVRSLAIAEGLDDLRGAARIVVILDDAVLDILI